MKDENQLNDTWEKIAQAARQPQDDGDTGAPFGFSTRVISQWAQQRRQQALAIWHRWAWQGAAFSVLLMLAAVAYGVTQPKSNSGDEVLFSVPTLNLPYPSDL
jgi:hypothetical protein